MNPFIPYLAKSVLCISLLFAVYWIFLRKDTFFLMNRIYLLTMVIFSVLFPLFTFSWVPTGTAASVVVILEPVLVMPARMVNAHAGRIGWIEGLFIVYLTGMFIFLFRFLVQLIHLMLLSRRFGMKKLKGLNVVCVDLAYSPFSFFNRVFINEKEVLGENLEAILNHENVHIRQMHTIDLFLMEILIILQWFNPFAWLTWREMKSVHEYLADEGVLQTGIRRSLYQQMILNETMGIQVNYLTNNFNVSLLKKRILMMTKSKSRIWAKSKLFFVLPVLLILWFIFSARSFSHSMPVNLTVNKAVSTTSTILPPLIQDKKKQEKQTHNTPVDGDKLTYKVVEKMPSYVGGDEAMVKFMVENIKYPENAIKNRIHGTVYVTFIVRADGSVTDVKILRGIGGGCDEEALRIVKMMPKWNPGESKGKPVDVAFNLPVKFKLDAGKKDKKQ